MRIHALVLFLFLAFPLVTAAQEDTDTEAYEAFSMAVHRHMESDHFEQSCTWGNIESTFILIPLNRDIVKTAVAYKAEADGLSNAERRRLNRQAIDEHVDGSLTTFLFLVHTRYGDDDQYVEIGEPPNTVKMFSETREYSLQKFTRIFGSRLPEGKNDGYLYFNNFRPSSSNSYSVHFEEIKLKCGPNYDPSVRRTTMAFDHSEVDFLSLVDDLSVDQIKNRTQPKTSDSDSAASASDLLNVASILVTVISLFA